MVHLGSGETERPGTVTVGPPEDLQRVQSDGLSLDSGLRQPLEDASGGRRTRLSAWIEQASTCTVIELERFASGIQRAAAAVLGAITSPWSNGQVEGQVTRAKLLKRQMYGRANFDLLRARILLA